MTKSREYQANGGKSSQVNIRLDNVTNPNIYAFDFECATKGAPDAYLCGIANIYEDSSFYYCDNIGDFLDYLSGLPHRSILYAHNLKYDYSYLYPVLCYRDVRFDEVITGRDKKIRTVKIYFGKRFIELRDSSPLFAPSSIPLKKVMASWCREHTVKDSVGFYEYRPATVSEEFFTYFKEDVLGLGEALRRRFALFPEQKTKLTTSSECKDMAKRIINGHFTHNKNFFDNVAFPVISLDVDKDLRKYYRGGYVWVNPLHKEKILKNIDVFDVNSMYPSIMESEMLPFGEPRPFKGKPSPHFSLFVVTIRVYWAEVKPFSPAFVTNGRCNIFGSTEYAHFISEDAPIEEKTLHLTNMELDLFLECYEVSGLEWLGGYSFKSRNDVFLPYIETFRELKENNTGAMREYAKLALNSPSGKWGQNPIIQEWISQQENGVQKFKERDDSEPGKPFYLPTSIFVTAYARMRLVRKIIKVGVKNSIYTDTDSLHVLNYKEGDFELHKTRFGYWDHEKHCEAGKYLRQKRYAHIIDGQFHSTVAGIPERYLKNVCTTLEEFTPGLQVPCERMRMQAGGMMMETMMITL